MRLRIIGTGDAFGDGGPDHRTWITARHLYLTHPGPEVLERQREVREHLAADGLVVQL